MLKDRWFIVGLLIIVLSAGSAFAIGLAVRRKTDGGAAVSHPPERPARPALRTTPPPAVVLPSPALSPGPRSTRVAETPPREDGDLSSAAAWRLLNAGRLRQAQEEFLQLRLISPTHGDAMRGLVIVRRRLAGDDPVVLRRQAAAYQQAIARRVETEEHFTAEAMAVLAQANLIAAEEIEAERARTQPTRVGATSGPSPRVQSTPSPRAQATPAPSPRVQTTPVPSPRAQTSPSPPPVAQPVPTPPQTPPRPGTPAPQATAVEPPVDVNEPFLVVRIGPISDAGRVSEIMGELTLSGYSAGVSRRDEPVSFQVVSETLVREVAERRAQVLAGYGFRSRLIPVAGGLALLEFGAFQSAEPAEALASRIRSRGYYASVVREGGTGFLITAGPYRQTVANNIVRLIRNRFGAGLLVSVSAAP
ncbi:MAG: SPOR domain-containing protein [Armatimonadota bacterium]